MPVRIVLVPGNCNDITCAAETLPEDIEGRWVLADKAYDANHFRRVIEERKGVAVIPPTKNRKDPVDYDREIGKLRHRVENFFCRIKRFRRVATRYDRLASTYLGFVFLSSIGDYVL